MAVTMAEITHLRKMTGAGMMDCKNALTEAEGDMDKAMEILRKKGQAVAAKRSDREAGEGCVLAVSDKDYAAVLALKCETDFVAKNADFVALAKEIINLAVKNRCKSLDEFISRMSESEAEQLELFVRMKQISSVTEGINAALEAYVKKTQKDIYESQMRAAAQDKSFIERTMSAQRDFENLDNKDRLLEADEW